MSLRRTCLLALAAAGLGLGSARAQSSAVWPPGFGSQPGGSAMAAPFFVSPNTSRDGARSIVLIDGPSLPFATGASVVGIAWRRDAVDRSSTYAARSGRLQLRIGPVADALRPANTLRDPWSSEPTKVYDQTFDLRATPPPAAGRAASFDLVVPFSSPWTWPGGDLAIDVVFQGPRGQHWRRDAVRFPVGEDARIVTLGSGCPSSALFRPLAWVDHELAVPALGGQLVARVDGLGRDAAGGLYGPAFWLLGAARASPLPLTALGLPASCEVHVDPFAAGLGVCGDASDRFGRAEQAWSLPADPRLVGASLALQWLVGDRGPGAPAALAASDAIVVALGRPVDPRSVGRTVWAYGVNALGQQFDGRLGAPGFVPVTRFDWR